MKDNFLLRKNLKEVVDELSDEDAGKLFKGILNYANTEDSKLDGYLKVIFIPIRADIDKNEERYEEVCKKNRENGKFGGRPRKDEKEEENREIIEETEENRMVFEETEENRMVFEETEENPKKPINHNHNHNQLSINELNVIKEIIDYLNLKTKSHFKYSAKTTQMKINARLNEGYKLNDFIAVIDKKYAEWFGTEYEKYLCPETLFGTKFEKYLNQKVTCFEENFKEITEEEKEILDYDWLNI